jgi:RimJ/RimL family protein N-acetyltransferase
VQSLRNLILPHKPQHLHANHGKGDVRNAPADEVSVGGLAGKKNAQCRNEQSLEHGSDLLQYAYREWLLCLHILGRDSSAFNLGSGMNSVIELRTPRLLLRHWRAEDREPFAQLNSDPRVMEHFPALLSRAESDARVERIETHFQMHGFGLWAVEAPGVAPFLGFVGLAVPAFEAAFTPCVEIGWRLTADYWGQGYATEGARRVMQYAFESLHLPEIVSFTVPANIRSRRVMEKLGMKHSANEDFDHPSLPEGHPLRRHVLYRIANDGSPV